MSGGSYNNLCYKDPDDLLGMTEELEMMADRLAGLGYAEDAALETQKMLCNIRQYWNRIEASRQRLQEVWKAVEYWDSRDSSEDSVQSALKMYRGDDQ